MASPKHLQNLDPHEFEKIVAALWEKKGFDTVLRPQTRDRGIDVEAEKVGAGWKEVIQVKRYSGKNKVGSDEIRKYATLYQQVPEANAVVVVTSGEFTSEAKTLADDLRVEIYDGQKLIQEISEMGVDISSSLVDETFPSTDKEESQNDTRLIRSNPAEITSYGSVDLGGNTIVEPQDYFRDHLKKRGSSAGLKQQPWVYVATDVNGLDLEFAWDQGLMNPKVNFAVSQNGVEYLDDDHRLTTVPLDLISNVEYKSHIMGLRKPTKLTFSLQNNTKHIVTLQRGYKKRNIKYLSEYIRS